MFSSPLWRGSHRCVRMCVRVCQDNGTTTVLSANETEKYVVHVDNN